MTRSGHRALLAVAIALVLASPSAHADPAQDERITRLEEKLNDLLTQAAALKDEIAKLKTGAPDAATVTPADAEDLTKIDVATAPPPAPSESAAATPPQPPSIADVQPVANEVNAGAAKVFNPDISVIGNVIGKAGDRNDTEFGPSDVRKPMSLDEAEVAFEAFIDPYAKGKFFISVGPNGAEVEEGFAQFVALPHDFTAKAGKMKATFGKANTWHTHVRPWVDQPLVVHNFFGDEGLADSGISVSRTFRNPFNAFIEATGEVLSGDVDGVFVRRNENDLFYNGHLKFFRDLSEDSNIELGTSYARGTLAEPGDLRRAASQFGGVDVTWRWKPLQRALYRSFIGRFEGIVNDRDDVAKHLTGFYASADYQLGQRWFTGLRIDRADRAVPSIEGDATRLTDRGASATLTFWPSEFSQLRGQLRRMSYGGAPDVTEFLFQLQFAIGAHGAHTF